MRKRERQFFCYKFSSSRLKKQKYNIKTNFNEARRDNEIIAIGDNQILRSIRDIKNIRFDVEVVDSLYEERNKIKQLPPSKENTLKIKNIQAQINHLLFFPEYVTITIDNPKHYAEMFYGGVVINGVPYKRFSCSAGQARTQTVVFCSCDIYDELKERLDNDRDKSIPIAPSKLNAYFGLYSSGTKLVTEPRFAVVADYSNKVRFKANFVTETDAALDDEVEVREIEQELDRMDGMGLISPEMAKQWGEDMGLDYTPSQFVVRQSFLKGLLAVFDFKEFCKQKNGGNYLIKTIYKDDNGEYIYEDLRDCDAIISESQFKLWNSYKSKQQYIDCYHKNKLYWGVTQVAKKEYKEMSELNYQFLQALKLSNEDILELCKPFEDKVGGVLLDNACYSLLYLFGEIEDEEKLRNAIRSNEMLWKKCLALDQRIIQDPYIEKQILKMINQSLNNACLGKIPVKGNFQFLVTDPYAYMQFVCGQEPTGLLKEHECFSNYWIQRDADTVIGMRSPLTSPSEPCEWKVNHSEEAKYWYQYNKNGVILNWFGNDVSKLAGADKLYCPC